MADDRSWAEARRLLRLAFHPSDDVTIVSEKGGPQKAPHVPNLIQSILYARRLLPSYLVVLVAVVLAWAIAKRVDKWATRRSSVSTGLRSPRSGLSSSASTLQGTDSPPLKDHASEDTPLLVEAQKIRGSDASLPRRTWWRVRSFLLRQPKPIPSLTAPRNTLPENETTIVILLFLALNLFYLLFRMPLTKEYIFSFADRAGLLFTINLPVLYILAAKNNQPLGWLTGWSYEGLNIFHRRLGEWLTIAAVIHAVGMIIGFYQLLAPFGYTLGWYLTRKIIILGILAFFSYMIIYCTSIGSFRQSFYELFLAVHIFLQVAALALLFFHHHDARPYVGAAAAIWVLDRGVSRIVCKTRAFIVTLEVAADEETVLVHCDVPVQRSWLASFGLKSGWQAGQHVFLTVPEIGFKHRFQAHPFTIASAAPPRNMNKGIWPLQLTIRAQDGFSRDLLQYAKHHQHTKVQMDGPYSSTDVLEAVEASDRVCLVAGGSGIAVTYPFAWSRETSRTCEEDIIYDRARYVDGKKRAKPSIVRSRKSLNEDRFAHFWVRQDARHESWVTMLPRRADTSRQHDEPENAIDLITHRFNTRDAVGGHRPDIKGELALWVQGDLKEKIDMRLRICVVVSGPDGLVRDVRNTVAALVREGWNIEVHVEKFGW